MKLENIKRKIKFKTLTKTIISILKETAGTL